MFKTHQISVFRDSSFVLFVVQVFLERHDLQFLFQVLLLLHLLLDRSLQAACGLGTFLSFGKNYTSAAGSEVVPSANTPIPFT